MARTFRYDIGPPPEKRLDVVYNLYPGCAVLRLLEPVGPYHKPAMAFRFLERSQAMDDFRRDRAEPDDRKAFSDPRARHAGGRGVGQLSHWRSSMELPSGSRISARA